MKWVIVITGIESDDPGIVEVRDRLLDQVGVPFDGTLTMKAWLFADYWHVSPPPMLEARLPEDKRLIREVMST